MLPGILFFIFAQLLVHAIFCLLIAFLAAMMIALLDVPQQKHLSVSISVWLASIVSVILANSYYFPNSHFAQLCNVWGGWVGASSAYPKFTHASFTSAATPAKPNIIIVGVDSLRPDVLAFFSGETKTPFMSRFLIKATVFNEAITPLARTYPSWVGILTGQYPLQTGARTNLSGAEKIDVSQTLPALLRQQGYETLYATDETRFSNIDKHFGFNTTVTPPVGLNDFLLGTFNDFPLSNLVVNTAIGKWLFPYSYGNRPAYVTYDPNSFLRLLQPAILRDHEKPLFLAVHFCLPHHPYLYDRMAGDARTGQERYLQSIERVDQQIRDFFKLLQQAQLLDHAVVVLLSDHGEALEFAGDRLTEREAYLPRHQTAPAYYPPSEDEMAMDQSVGHGTDVLGLPQYHSLLAFRFYGLDHPQAIGTVPGVVSLLDIKPTVLALTRSPDTLFVYGNQPSNISPISLAPLITGALKHPPTRMLFLESDYSPDAIRSVYPETRKLLLEGADLFQINADTTRVTVKEEMVDKIIKSKQYAVIYGNWMLALYPTAAHNKIPVLVNLKSGAWTTELSSSFARTSPAEAMRAALKRFYGAEV